MIRQAPLAFVAALCFAAAVVGYLEYQLTENRFLQQISDLSTANQRLDATAKSLQATIQYQDERLAQFSGKQPANSEEGFARLQMIDVKIISEPEDLKINMFMQNTGTLAAVGFIHSSGGGMLDKEMTADDLDKLFLQLKSAMKDAETRRLDAEIQPNEGSWFSTFLPISAQQYAQVTNGSKFLYFVMLGEYKDNDAPPNKWRATEVCLFTFQNQGMHRCDQHNRIFLSD